MTSLDELQVDAAKEQAGSSIRNAGTLEQSAQITPQPHGIARSLLWTMAIASGLAAGNLYYNQPLLDQIGRNFAVTQRQVGILPSLSQFGYASGLFLLVPLGDILERRRLIVSLCCLVILSLIVAACAPTLLILALSTYAIGLLTIMAQVLLPFAAHLAAPEERGKIVGSIMSGLLIGILLSRTVSGFVGDQWGWRTMYWLAAGLMMIMTFALRVLLPQDQPAAALSYRELLASIFQLVREQPILRESALSGALVFACFSAFWATMVFLLDSPAYHLGARVAGSFGLVGAAGALAAPLVGRLADKSSPRLLVQGATCLILLGYVIFWLFGFHIWGLVLGVILLDLGVQSAHISNQTRVFSLLLGAHSRLNTVYMVSYFIGGSAGSYLGALGWSLGQWHGVCMVGVSCSLLLLGYFLVSYLLAGKRESATMVRDSV
ncbi:MAG: MFS transporter [Abitibacteriaceae bacterium]|nr:MFS transporter [Abditibacteriaceae bacterium]